MSSEISSSITAVPTSHPARLAENRSVAESESGKQVPPTGQVEPEPAAPSDEDLREAVEMLEVRASRIGRDLQFEVDSDSGTTVIKVIDPETEEVVRQIPSEEAVSRARGRDPDGMTLIDDLA